MKNAFIFSLSALTLFSCGGAKQNQNGAQTAEMTSKAVVTAQKNETPKPEEKPEIPPYGVDNFSGNNVDFSRPVLITVNTLWKDDNGSFKEDGEPSIAEYCRYDAKGRILEYGCFTGQFDYEGYIRMFKICYSGEKIDSVQWKEVYSGKVEEKKDEIFKNGVSIFDIVTGKNIGFMHEADKDVKDLDPYSPASMRQYADTKSDILERQFGIMYDFSGIKKWDKENRDGSGRLTYSEYKNEFGDGEYEHYKIKYTYGEDFVRRNFTKKQRVEFEGDVDESEYNYVQVEKYLRTNEQLEPAKPAAAVEKKMCIAEKIFREQFPDIKEVYCRDSLFVSGAEDEECEGCMSDRELACYPLKNGGYLVVDKHAFAGPGCSAEYDFVTWIYGNDKMKNAKISLPVPELDDLLNPDKVSDYADDVKEFRKMFKESTASLICYEFQPPETLTVMLHPWDCGEAHYNMNKVMLDPYNEDKVPVYKWDGEKFTKQ